MARSISWWYRGFSVYGEPIGVATPAAPKTPLVLDVLAIYALQVRMRAELIHWTTEGQL